MQSNTVRTYLLLAAAEFRRFSTYRLAILAGVFTQSVFGFIRVSILFARSRRLVARWRRMTSNQHRPMSG